MGTDLCLCLPVSIDPYDQKSTLPHVGKKLHCLRPRRYLVDRQYHEDFFVAYGFANWMEVYCLDYIKTARLDISCSTFYHHLATPNGNRR